MTTDLFSIDRMKDMSKRRSIKGTTTSTTISYDDDGPRPGDVIRAADFARPKQTANAALEMTMVIYGVTVLGIDEPSAIDVASDVMESHVKSANTNLDTSVLLAAYREAAKGTLPL